MFTANQLPLRCIQWAAICLCFGWAWQFFFLDAPVRAFLWDESLFQPVVHAFGRSWSLWLSDLQVDDTINQVVKSVGFVFFLTGSLLVFHLPKTSAAKWMLPFVWFCTFWLVFIYFCYYLDVFHQLGQFLEYALQAVALPVWYFAQRNGVSNRVVWVIKCAAALCFFNHGLYAIGFYPQPGHWQQIAINLTGVTNATAKILLKIFGYLDFIAVVFLFLPRPFQKAALWYMFLWGLASALARPIGLFNIQFIADWAGQHIHEAVLRMPHALLPAALLWHKR
jgi:hypothetical protein